MSVTSVLPTRGAKPLSATDREMLTTPRMKPSVAVLTAVLVSSLFGAGTEALVWNLGGQWDVYNVSSSKLAHLQFVM